MKETAKREEIRESLEEKRKQLKLDEKKKKKADSSAAKVHIPAPPTNEPTAPSNGVSDTPPVLTVTSPPPVKRSALDRFKK